MKILLFFVTTLAAIVCLYGCNQPAVKAVEENKAVATDSNSVQLQVVTTSISSPIQMSIPADGTNRKFITDRKGRIWIIEKDSLLPKPYFDITTKPDKEIKTDDVGAINCIAFHPQFATNHKFYVSYNAVTSIAANKSKMVIDEFTEDKNDHNVANKKSSHRVFELEGTRIFTNGAQIAFGPDGYLYVSIGDDAFGDTSYVNHAQDLNYLYGKLLRIDVNKIPYGIPPDNPFVGMRGKRPEIWAYGFRKMWRFSFDPKSQRLFGADVGEKKEEEIDIVTKGANYGWPVMEGDSIFKPAQLPGENAFTSPINTYTHKDGICVIGGNFYYGKAIPFLRNKFVFGDLKTGLFTLTDNHNGKWVREAISIRNKPAFPFLICALDKDQNNEFYVMGFLNKRTGFEGVVYKIIKG